MHSNITTINGDTAFLELIGRVETGRDTERLETILGGFANGEYRWAVIDLAGVAYFDGSAVDALVEAIKRRNGTSVKILNSTQMIRDSIRIKLGKVFAGQEDSQFFGDEAERIAHLDQSRQVMTVL